MPRKAKELTALDIKHAKHPDPNGSLPVIVAVGGVAGLYLQITPNDAKSWVLRTVIGNRRRAIGMGSFPEISLATARERAASAKLGIRDGVDPVEQRRAAKAELAAKQAREITFAKAVEKYKPTALANLGTQRSKDRWEQTITDYALPKLGSKRVNEITVQDIVDTLMQPHAVKRGGAKGPLWQIANETASKTRGRIENIISWAKASGYCDGDNPAKWTGNLVTLMVKPSMVTTTVNYPSLQIDDAQRWMAMLRERTGISARCLEFTTLTAVRSGEARGAQWSEINLDKALWTIPAARMKIKDNGDHVVPLSPAALAVLQRLHNTRDPECGLVFPTDKCKPLSDMALSMLMRGMSETAERDNEKPFVDAQSGKQIVPHGLRSTFSTWANDHAEYPPDMIEFALAHRVGNKVAQAYRRKSMVEKRRKLMNEWADFLSDNK